jgi:hypothetical protein
MAATAAMTGAMRSARAAGATGPILVRGDSAYGSAAVIGVAPGEGAQFSLVLAKNPAVVRAIAAIAEDAWMPVRYPGARRRSGHRAADLRR